MIVSTSLDTEAHTFMRFCITIHLHKLRIGHTFSLHLGHTLTNAIQDSVVGWYGVVKALTTSFYRVYYNPFEMDSLVLFY